MLKRNDASAQWYAGLLHHHGYGVRKDSALAREWYEKSGAGGFPLAAAGLADLDASRLEPCVPGSAPTTVLSFYRARYAPDKLICSKKDRGAAFRTISADAAAGDIDAQILLGTCYERGIHVEENWDVALDWYRGAAFEGSEEAGTLFARLSTEMDGDEGAWDRHEAEVIGTLARSSSQRGCEPSGVRKAIKWRLKGAEEGDRYACWRLHELYLLDKGVKQDREKSAKWLIRACEGHADEAVRRYFESVRPRIEEVIDEHILDVALRADLKTSITRAVTASAC
jgi:TPR repeat protein